MHTVVSRAGRWPLALSFAALIALSACADDPVAPTTIATRTPTASAAADAFIEVTVTNASGGYEFGSLQWAVQQIRSGGGAVKFDPSLDGGTITLDSPLNSDGPLYLVGPTKGITLSGNDQHRVIDGTAPISAKNVTFTKGYGDYASAIRASSAYLDNSTVRDNRGPGSAIRAQYVLSLINSTVSRNVVGYCGGRVQGERAGVHRQQHHRVQRAGRWARRVWLSDVFVASDPEQLDPLEQREPAAELLELLRLLLRGHEHLERLELR